MTIQEYIENKVKAIFREIIAVVTDYSTDYEDFITNYSQHLPGAMIAYDGFNSYTRYERGMTYIHTYRLIINVNRIPENEDRIIDLRDAIYKEVFDDKYELNVVRGVWLPTGKSQNTFEYTIEAIEG